MKKPLRYVTLFLFISLIGCSGNNLQVNKEGEMSLSSCFPLPNCVSSSAWFLYNHVDEFELVIPEEKAWPIINEVIRQTPRTEIVKADAFYIHAEYRSRVFGFVDHLELLLHKQKGAVSVRSSSSIALFDFCVNYFRVNELREQLIERGVIEN